jgi:hypothetical protein
MSFLGDINFIPMKFTVVSTVDIYKSGVLWAELKAFLNQKGFKEAISGTPSQHCDVLFVSEK